MWGIQLGDQVRDMRNSRQTGRSGRAAALLAAGAAAAALLTACASEPASSTSASGNEGSVGASHSGSTHNDTQALPGFAASQSTELAASQATLKDIKPGAIRLTPAKGSATSTPQWSTTTACPSGYQGSAILVELNKDGSVASQIGTDTQQAVSTPFVGGLQANVATIMAVSNVAKGTPATWVFECYPNGDATATGPHFIYSQAIYVTVSADGKSFSSSASR
jgi:hypothetical protein